MQEATIKNHKNKIYSKILGKNSCKNKMMEQLLIRQ
jgi:hypothetical protein